MRVATHTLASSRKTIGVPISVNQNFSRKTAMQSNVCFVLSMSGPLESISCQKGASHGIVRLSSAMQAVPSSNVRQPRPGMGLKMLRDGMDSVNVVSVIQFILQTLILTLF